jgi:hypothetical protein
VCEDPAVAAFRNHSGIPKFGYNCSAGVNQMGVISASLCRNHSEGFNRQREDVADAALSLYYLWHRRVGL